MMRATEGKKACYSFCISLTEPRGLAKNAQDIKKLEYASAKSHIEGIFLRRNYACKDDDGLVLYCG